MIWIETPVAPLLKKQRGSITCFSCCQGWEADFVIPDSAPTEPHNTYFLVLSTSERPQKI